MQCALEENCIWTKNDLVFKTKISASAKSGYRSIYIHAVSKVRYTMSVPPV